MAKKLDYNAPFATVHGIGSAAAYSQNGVYFNASGVEVDLETGEEVFDEGSAPDAEASPSKKTKATVTSADVI